MLRQTDQQPEEMPEIAVVTVVRFSSGHLEEALVAIRRKNRNF